jgi:large subunit ribosomal protein L1
MTKLTKKAKVLQAKVDSTKLYALDQALAIVKECATAKFDESIDVAVQLGIDAKKSDQVVRGAVVMPAGTGKTKRVAVFAQGAKAEEAKAAGADIVGMDDLAAEIKAGKMDFDVVIASPDTMRVVGTLGQILGPRGLMPNPKVGTVTPDVAQAVRNAKAGKMDFDVVIASPDTMRVVGTLGQILGPRGLMPNPKVGTVTPDVAQAVRNAKAGQVQFRVDKAGIIHGTIGRRSFESDKLVENLRALIDALNKAKPSSSKGVYLRKVAVSSTMGVGVRVDTQSIAAQAAA